MESKKLPGADLCRCHDCGVTEGQLHELGCDMEYCPFCGEQLITCDCPYDSLGLRDPRLYTAATAYLPPSIYEEGLSEVQGAQWEAELTRKGRIPYIVYPVLCAKCGVLWPEFFRVPDAEWERYVQPNMRDQVLCELCWLHITHVIDTMNGMAQDAPPDPRVSFDDDGYEEGSNHPEICSDQGSQPKHAS
jgi:hypothetical protein